MLVVMGEKDPDWRDPASEVRWIAERLGGEPPLLPTHETSASLHALTSPLWAQSIWIRSMR